MMEAVAEEESHFALILGKPGGGKGTISGKILEVSLLEARNELEKKIQIFRMTLDPTVLLGSYYQ
jgi:hypothetical protein